MAPVLPRHQAGRLTRVDGVHELVPRPRLAVRRRPLPVAAVAKEVRVGVLRPPAAPRRASGPPAVAGPGVARVSLLPSGPAPAEGRAPVLRAVPGLRPRRERVLPATAVLPVSAVPVLLPPAAPVLPLLPPVRVAGVSRVPGVHSHSRPVSPAAPEKPQKQKDGVHCI